MPFGSNRVQDGWDGDCGMHYLCADSAIPNPKEPEGYKLKHRISISCKTLRLRAHEEHCRAAS
jgi:hypothetical protein